MSSPVLDAFARDAPALKGTRGTPCYAPEPVEAGAIRRFAQAIMDPNPLYWDPDFARTTSHGEVIAPPLFPLHSARRRAGAADPLDAALTDPDFDGGGNFLTDLGLPRIEIPLPRLLNGGCRITFFSHARLGDLIRATSTYDDLYLKQGSSGPLVFVIVQTDYESLSQGDTRRLLQSKQTYIWR